ncbi:MAG: hypothetical protein H7832_06655 [Magnetococcus sp. DMHC-6]
MRVTQNMLFRSGVYAMQERSQDMMVVQEQSVSGNRVNRPSEDPTATYRHLMFSADLSGVQSLKKTTVMATERIKAAESNIDAMYDTMLSAQELALQYGNSFVGGDPEIMKAASTNVFSYYQDFLKNVNQEMDGIPLFGGGRTISPFDETKLTVTDIQRRSKNVGDFQDVSSGFQATLSSGYLPKELPLSVKMIYASVDNTFTVNVNGVDKGSFSASATDPGSWFLQVGEKSGEGFTFQYPMSGLQTAMKNSTASADGTDIATFSSEAVNGSKFASTAAQTNIDAVQAVLAQAVPGSDLNLLATNMMAADTGGTLTREEADVLAKATVTYATSREDAVFIAANTIGPQNGDAFYFEVVPKYQGGTQDRSIKVMNGRTLSGNVTGGELIEGTQNGRGVNIFSILAGLRGAMLRGDTTEVQARINEIQNGAQQISDLQGVTGVRYTQVDSVSNTLETDEANLTESMASNSEADLYEVLSHMQQISQSLDVLASTQREILNNSILNYLN